MSLEFPADVMLVVAMNPCPCGYATDLNHHCTCSQHQIALYRSRISGPLLDRIDIQVEVPALRYKEMRLNTQSPPEASSSVRERVSQAREVQRSRFKRSGIYCNAQMSKRQLRGHCALNAEGHQLLETVIDKLGMSARATDRILKVARTIADLAGEESIHTAHLAEAIQYRSLDRSLLN
jgi:magnesium chelatase family protein